ncbi:hypothetical protein BRADI_3g32043v3 [Brachypodium distachyon]|uniref:Reverse transcriptase zinc-binding domain-containing protein n=1 Tax=Brachypodium distachyon TaxID=15368 RepID=A0A2K2D0H6_BRADI|nr:hypothetical protein BRADI_3g32043v3 [Brachypodium distachyon]
MSGPKEAGGLGFLDSRIRNVVLLVKWIAKLEGGCEDLSCRLLRAKYFSHGGFFQSSSAQSSQFWKGLHAVKSWFKFGCEYRLGNGASIHFWNDVWLGQAPLDARFHRLF